jgi:hypothetical protein
MICWNSYLITLEQNSMQHLNNIPTQPLDNIKRAVREGLSSWSNDWMLAENNFQIDISFISKAEFKTNECKFYGAATKVILVNEVAFQWQKAIFSDIKIPTNTGYLDLVKLTTADLLKAISKENSFVEQKAYKLPAHIDIFLLVSIHSAECGRLKLIVPYSCIFNVFQIRRVPTTHNVLAKKVDVVDAQKCKFKVQLNFGEFPLNEMNDLKVGAILRSSIAVENKFTLEANGISLASIAIGKISNKKVFMVINGEKK